MFTVATGMVVTGVIMTEIFQRKRMLMKKTLSSWDKETEVSQEELTKMEEISQEFIDGMITYHQLIERVNKECPNINPYDYMDGRGSGRDWY